MWKIKDPPPYFIIFLFMPAIPFFSAEIPAEPQHPHPADGIRSLPAFENHKQSK